MTSLHVQQLLELKHDRGTPSRMSLRSCEPTLPVQVMGPAAFAGTDVMDMASRSSRRVAPELCLNFKPPKIRGRREGRVLAGTRGLVCNKRKKNAHEHTGISRGIRPSLRNGLTAYNALSLETNSSCLHRRRIGDSPKPGWARQISASLTPATGARTTRLCRTQQRLRLARERSLTGKPALRSISRARRFRVHRIPDPTSVTIAIRPSCGPGWRGF